MNKDLLTKIRSIVNDSGYRPLNKSEFARELSVPPKERVLLRKALAEMVEKGELKLGKKARYYQNSGKNDGTTHAGIIYFSSNERRKSAFFVPDDPDNVPSLKNKESDRLYVAGRHTGKAIDGDRVSVQIFKKGPPKWHRHVKSKQKYQNDDFFEARVVEVLQRNITSIVGIFHRHGPVTSLCPEDKKLPASFQLKEVLAEAKPGDLVVAEFLGWADSEHHPSARMVKILGKPNDPGVDMLTVIHRHRLPLEFPPETLQEAAAIDDVIDDETISRREDWRDREVFTIDPGDARDFDDAISVLEFPDGKGWELAVHIADVSHYVKPDSALDKEARKRGNSVYLADRVIPMLPEKLSNGVCSLNPGVDRLTHAAIIEFDGDAKMKNARFVSAIIRSCRRYTYEEAFTRLQLSEKAAREFEDPVEKSVVAHLRRAWKLAEKLRQRRSEQGCFDLDFPEVRVILDDQGIAFGVKKTEHDESHQLIEEFMLAANEAVARETRHAPAPSIYRIHEDPDFEKLEEFADLAWTFGHQIGDPANRSEIQKLTASIRGKPEEQSLKLALLKSMKRAAYSKDPIGHYGLAKADYCHFTSPIRRYADLVVHRSLKKIMSRRGEASAPEHPDKTPNEAGAGEIAAHISRTERVAADAERDSQQLKIIEYLENLIKDDRDQVFAAMVVEVRPIGVFVELKDLMVRGLIRKADLPVNADYYFDRSRNRFVSGNKRGKPIGMARELSVRLIRIDRARGFLDFSLVR